MWDNMQLCILQCFTETDFFPGGEPRKAELSHQRERTLAGTKTSAEKPMCFLKQKNILAYDSLQLAT